MKNKHLISLSLTLFSTILCFNVFAKTDQAIEATKSFIEKQKIDTSKPHWKTKLTKPPLLNFSNDKTYFWDLNTNQGQIIIKLFQDAAPMHVSSTIYLTTLGFYDDLIFHRVIPGFMMQGGDPLGVGSGHPGYKYAGEFDMNNRAASHFQSGMLSMANSGPNSDGSQFFITFKATPFLDGRHTVFGEVVKGLHKVLPRIEALGTRSGKPQSEVKIIKATIRTEEKIIKPMA